MRLPTPSIRFAPIVISLLLFLHIRLHSSVEIQGFEVRDLGGAAECFTLQGNSWTASSLVSSSQKSSTCINPILGGPNILNTGPEMFFQRTYRYLPFHNKIYFALTLYAIDQWVPLQVNRPLIQITFDSTVLENVKAQSISTSSLCSLSLPDSSIRLFGKIDHSALSLDLKIGHIHAINSAQGSFGFRNLTLLFSSDNTTSSDHMCGLGIDITEGRCDCEDGEYLDASGDCQPCAQGCKSCFGPTTGDCYECLWGYGFDGTKCVKCDASCGMCLSSAPTGCTGCKNKYALYDGVCRPNCPAPLNQTMDACKESFCRSACAPPNILFPDGYCGTACAAPLVTILSSGSLKCRTPCTAGVPYLYWNETCKDVCELPLQNRTDHGITYCDFTCLEGEYLHSNGNCTSDCNLPFKGEMQGGKLFCFYPCRSDQYLYLNGSCTDTCLAIDTWTENGKNYCHYPSQETPPVPTCAYPLYEYWNGSCLPVCNSPLTINYTGDSRHCEYPCSMNDFLYWDGRCLAKCDAPLVQRIEDDYKFCDLPCSQNQYISVKGLCINSCAPPLRVEINGDIKLCRLPCDDPTMYYHKATKQCTSDCNTTYTSHNGYLICSSSSSPSSPPDPDPYPYPGEVPTAVNESSLPTPTEAGTVTFITLTKFMQYIRYLDVQMPRRMEKLAISRGRPVLSLQPGPQLTSTIYKWFNNQTMDGVVNRHNLHPRFLANFGGEIFILIIICSAALFFTFLHSICRKKDWRIATMVFEKLQILTRWNLPLMLFGTYLDDIILFSSIEFTTLKFDGSSSVLSFLACVTTIAATVAFFVGIFKIAGRSKRNQISQSKNEGKLADKYFKGNFQVFYGGFNTAKPLNRFFFLIYMCRSALPMLFAIILVNVPIVEEVFQILTSLAIFVYVLYMRPLKSKINQCQLVLIESIVLVMNISALIVTVFDSRQMSHASSSVFFGDVVIIGNIMINALVIIILGIKVIFTLKEIKTLYHKDPTGAKVSCVHLLALPLQQGAFGFEQLLGDINPSLPASPNIAEQKQMNSIETIHLEEGKIHRQQSMSPRRISPRRVSPKRVVTQEEPVTPVCPPTTTAQINTFNRKTSLAGEEEISELPTTERFGQSSARLLMTSQVLSQSQVLPQQNNLVSMSDSILDLSVSSPRHKRVLSTFLKKVNNHNPNLRDSVRESRANSHYEDYEKDPRPIDLSKSSMIVRTRQMRNPITRAQTNMDLSGNNEVNSSLPPLPNMPRGLMQRNNSSVSHLRQEL